MSKKRSMIPEKEKKKLIVLVRGLDRARLQDRGTASSCVHRRLSPDEPCVFIRTTGGDPLPCGTCQNYQPSPDRCVRNKI